MESITIKVKDKIAKEIDKATKAHYTTKTEFIREAIRDKIKDLEKEKALLRLEKAYGASKRKTTDAQLKKAREEAAKDIAKDLGVSLD